MVLNGWRQWLKRRSLTSTRARFFRPLVETLEDRRLLAAFVVNSAGDEPDGNYLAPYNDHIGDTGDSPIFDGSGNLIGFTPFTGLCTLRAAIQQADADGVPATITFDPSVTKIVTTGLPLITVPIVIDGTNAAGKPGVELVAGGGAADGMVLMAGGSTVKGMDIHGFSSVGIALSGGGGNVIQGNYIGTDITGTMALPNAIGVGIDHSPANTIGGTMAAARNLISGNTVWGVSIFGPSAMGNVVEGNYIGTDVTGLAALGNGQGVTIGAPANTIGGIAGEATRNVISGNTKDGVYLQGFATLNTVEGNFIGTDKTGAVALPNLLNGVHIDFASTNLIGGDPAVASNVISGNAFDGVLISGASATKNVVQGNFIGTDNTSHALANGYNGVDVVKGASSNTIGGKLIGSTSGTLAANVISGNKGAGVRLADAGTTMNLVQANYLGTDAAGAVAVANGLDGVDLVNGAAGNTVGGAAVGNVISGNALDGIFISDAGTTGNLVQNNFIGTDAAGGIAVANGLNGVALVNGAASNTLGGAGLGNIISGNDHDGIFLLDAATTGNLVQNNFIGTDKAGTAALANLSNGVEIIGATTNTLGGDPAVASNVISGNGADGVLVSGATATKNVVQGNFIGTDNASHPLPNGAQGVEIVAGASSNTIGGKVIGSTSGALAANVISGNTGVGVRLADAGTTMNRVQGNYLGTDAAGAVAVPNGSDGVAIVNGAANNTVGGAGLGNIISGNGGDGVHVADLGTTGNLVQGNLIGTDQTGNNPLANSGNGVALVHAAATNSVGGAGLPLAGLGNLISGNGGDGVLLSDDGTTANLVQGNLIGTNLGSTAEANTQNGVEIVNGASGNTIGGIGPPGGGAALGNVISANGNDGVRLAGSTTTNNLVQGNFIGTTLAGNAALGNTQNGVELVDAANNNAIGGANAAPVGLGNVIAGNGGDGVRLSGVGTTMNQVQGNFIGTDVSGAKPLGNTFGVAILAGASSNTIGGTTAATANVISANSADGVHLADSGTTVNLVQGNNIGTDATGKAALGNGGAGVSISNGADDNQVGGAVDGQGNLISGNTGDGVLISDANASNNKVSGNWIGLDVTGTAALANGGDGVGLVNGASENSIGIGGTGSGKGNVISGNSGNGVHISDAGTMRNVVQGNFIGTDPTGASAVANSGDGVLIADGAATNFVGGPGGGKGNLISANSGDGVHLAGQTTTGNKLQGNYIGTDFMGKAALPNQLNGVEINGAPGNIIGAMVPGPDNVISGNTNDGVLIVGSDATGNKLQGNFIGTDVTGKVALPNHSNGVEINGAANNIIGAMAPGPDNVISGNTAVGVLITGAAATGNRVQANFIGTDVTGAAAVANGLDGVDLVKGATGNTIGGVGLSNVISGNALDGIFFSDAATTTNQVQGNFIGTNKDGAVALPNQLNGVALVGAAANTIGGNAMGAGNVISGNAKDGVLILDTTATKNVVQGNFIGTDSASHPLPNGVDGVGIRAGASSSTLTGNVISGNVGVGVRLSDTGTTMNLVQANFIGCDAAGAGAVPNGLDGVDFVKGASGNTIGGVGQGNVISGNALDGIFFSDAATTGNMVQGNFIGTNKDGTAPLPNQLNGVGIVGAASNTIGGNAMGAGNVISANARDGVLILDVTATKNVVQGNYIGTNAALAKTLGNGNNGVDINNSSQNVIGAPAGSADQSLGNWIAYNGQVDKMHGDGVVVVSGTQDTIRLNHLFANKRLGIDLNDDYFDRYIPTNFGKGANNNQYHPTVVSVDADGTIHWMLNAPPAGIYTIDVYADPNNDNHNYAEGQTPQGAPIVLGAPLYTVNGVGHWEFTTKVGTDKITATATDANGNTSEFSLADKNGDGLCDTWKANGFIDLHGNGTKDALLPNPRADGKDVYVEYDSMKDWGPVDGVLASVQAVFTAHKITLHLDAGKQDIAPEAFGDTPWPSFQTIKRANFADGKGQASDAYIAKLLAYRYCLFAVTFINSRGNTESSGLGEILGNDFMVTLGDPSFFGGKTAAAKDAEGAASHALVKETQAGTFLHELGHTLGLSHVGPVNWDGSTPRTGSQAVVEYAAGYESVMNYRYQGGGIGFTNAAGRFVSDPQILNYSEADPNEWANLWFAFQENPQSLAGGDTSTDPDIDPTDSRPTLDPSMDDLLPIVDPQPSSSVAVGDAVPVSFNIVNIGPATAAGSTFTLTVPNTLTLGPVSVTQGTVSVAGNTIVASLGDLANLDGATLSVTVTPTEPGAFTLTGQAASTTPDGAADNNSVTISTEVTPAPVTGSGAPVAGVEGTSLTNVPVATFTYAAGSSEPASDFSASIDWGDGSTTPRTIIHDSGSTTLSRSPT
jgi:CSLREA domain-containing protein